MCCAETFAYLHNAAFVCPRHCLYGSCNNIAREFYEFSKIYNHNKADVAEAKYKSLIENGSTLEAKVWGYLGLRLLGKITDKQAINNLQKLSGNVRFLKGKVLEVSPKQAYLWLTSDYLLVSPRFTVSNYPSIPEVQFLPHFVILALHFQYL